MSKTYNGNFGGLDTPDFVDKNRDRKLRFGLSVIVNEAPNPRVRTIEGDRRRLLALRHMREGLAALPEPLEAEYQLLDKEDIEREEAGF